MSPTPSSKVSMQITLAHYTALHSVHAGFNFVYHLACVPSSIKSITEASYSFYPANYRSSYDFA